MRALVVLAASAVLGLAGVGSDTAGPPAPPAARPATLGPYALADGILGLSKPPAPATVSAVPHDRSALVSWSGVTTVSGGTIVGYRVYVDGVRRAPDHPASQRSATVTLSNYQSYQITVRAVDNGGNPESLDSSAVAVTPFDDVAPSAVTGLTATRGDGRVTLTWEPESAIDADRAGVRVYVDDALRTSLPAATTTYDVTGLTNDVEHSFHLVAYDARPNGYGPPGSAAPNASAPSVTVTATPTDLTPPSAPTAFTAVRGDASAALTWTAPPEGDVGRYEVIDENGALVASFAAPATSGTATAMTNGRAYRLRLVAVDTHGNHSAPTGAVAVTPLAPPLPLTGLAVATKGASANLTWDAPARAGDHADAVQVQVWRAGSPDQLLATVPASQRAYQWKGYVPGASEAFYVVALDADPRPSPPSAVVVTVLEPPQAVAATVESGRTRITWEAVVGASTYRVEQVDAQGRVTQVGTVSDTFYDVTGLSDGTTYTFQVLALDARRRSAPSAQVAVTPLGLPAAVRGLRAERSGPDAVLSWTAPATPPTDVAATAQVRLYRVGSPDVLVGAVAAGTTTYAVPGAADATPPPSFYLVALDAHGRTSAPSASVSLGLGAPQAVSATSGPQSAHLAWAAVPGAEAYRVERLVGSGWVAQSTVTTTSLDVAGLTDGTQHTFRVVATAPSAGTAESGPSLSVTVTAGYSGPTTPLPEGSGGSIGVAVSRDGRYAVVAVPGAAGAVDLVRVDRLGPERRTVAAGIDATLPRFARAAISDDGRYVVLVTKTSHSDRVKNGRPDLYRYDVVTDTWALVSAPAGTGAQGSATDPVPQLVGGAITTPDQGPTMAITGDGSRVYFLSGRTDLVGGDTNNAVDLFAKDVATGTVTRITPASGYTPTGTGFAVTPDGRYVLYASGSNLVRQSTTSPDQRVLVTDAAGNPLGPLPGVGQLAISDDGARVLATSVSGTVSTLVQADLTAPVPPPTGAPVGTPPKVRATAVTTVDYGGGQVAIAPGGTHAFVATKAALVPADTNGHVDVYRVDLATGDKALVTAGPGGGGAVGSDASTAAAQTEWGSITARDADHVVVVTRRPLVAADGNGVRDAYAVDLGAPPAGRARLLVGGP